VAHLARSLGLPQEVCVKSRATREWIIARLQTSQIVDLACHGVFDARDVLQSHLLLAQGATLTLAEILNHTIDLRGLRLLILSGCQTALIDQRGARDEVRSLAAGMVQAGARAVLATLWPVDDEAAYLLVARFAQEWFPQIEDVPPATALARAQHWLRTVTNQELREWRAQMLPINAPGGQEYPAPLSQPLPWNSEREAPAMEGNSGRLRGVRGRGLRLELPDAEWRVRVRARRHPSHAQPFADPIFWAGFQLMGW
jgi:CHAT domain-containing protein